MKHYLISQASLEMAHRSKDSELVGRIFSQRKNKKKTPVIFPCETRTLIEEDTSGYKTIQGDNHADTYNPNHPQIVRFYKKWGKRE